MTPHLPSLALGFALGAAGLAAAQGWEQFQPSVGSTFRVVCTDYAGRSPAGRLVVAVQPAASQPWGLVGRCERDPQRPMQN